MSKTMTNVKLLDGDTGNIYTLSVSEEDAVKVSHDMSFAIELLSKLKKTVHHGQDEVLPEEDPLSHAGSSTLHDDDIPNDETLCSQDDDCSQNKDGFRWPHEAILLLLEVYRKHENQTKTGKMTMKKFWELVASKLIEKNYTVTGIQCKSKMAGLRNTYKSVRDYNSKSGNGTRVWRYFDIMEEIFTNKPGAASALTSEGNDGGSLRVGQNIDLKRSCLFLCGSEPSAKCSRQCTMMEKVLAVIKESAKERRKMHNEAMARQDKLIDILEKIIQK